VSPARTAALRRFGRRLPLFAGGAVVALGYAMTLRVGSNATYWADIFPPILLLSLGMSLAIAPLTTLVLTSVESDRAGTASGVNQPRSTRRVSLAIACSAASCSRRSSGCSQDFTCDGCSRVACVLGHACCDDTVSY